MKINKYVKPLLIGIVIALLLSVTTITILVIYSGDKGPTAFFARSLDDASYDCEDKIESRFEENLINKSFDNLSSRYDAKKRQYTVYYRVDVREETDDAYVFSQYLAKCVVWERLGYVSDFQIIDI